MGPDAGESRGHLNGWGEDTAARVEAENKHRRAFPIFTAYVLRGSASVVFIGCLSFPAWPFHSRSDSCLSISTKSFIESVSGQKVAKGSERRSEKRTEVGESKVPKDEEPKDKFMLAKV